MFITIIIIRYYDNLRIYLVFLFNPAKLIKQTLDIIYRLSRRANKALVRRKQKCSIGPSLSRFFLAILYFMIIISVVTI